jgi:ribokinase
MIWVVGSLNFDLTAPVEHLPRSGQTISALGMETAPGGKGANQALAAARAGARVRMVGAVGTDSFAAPATALLREGGLDLSALATVPGPTGIALILRDSMGENVIAVVPGANATVTPEQVQQALGTLQVDDIVLLQLEIPRASILAALHQARAVGARSILNIAPLSDAQDVRALVDLADIIIANETECADWLGQDLSGQARLDAVRAMLAQGQHLILTLGSEGAYAISAAQVVHAPALPVVPVDTVGAGDTFCGYFAAALAEGSNLHTALLRGAVAGSLACLAPGAQPAIPLRAQVDMRLAQSE